MIWLFDVDICTTRVLNNDRFAGKESGKKLKISASLRRSHCSQSAEPREAEKVQQAVDLCRHLEKQIPQTIRVFRWGETLNYVQSAILCSDLKFTQNKITVNISFKFLQRRRASVHHRRVKWESSSAPPAESCGWSCGCHEEVNREHRELKRYVFISAIMGFVRF